MCSRVGGCRVPPTRLSCVSPSWVRPFRRARTASAPFSIMMIPSPVDPPEKQLPSWLGNPAKAPDPLPSLDTTVHGQRVEVFVSKEPNRNFVLVYGAQPHQPIGSRPAFMVRITPYNFGQPILLHEDEVFSAAKGLEIALQFMEANQGRVPVTYREND